jgi:hypothetical protein
VKQSQVRHYDVATVRKKELDEPEADPRTTTCDKSGLAVDCERHFSILSKFANVSNWELK